MPSHIINTSPNTPLWRKNYFIAIICALHIECLALRYLFDEEYDSVSAKHDDPNQYALGRIAEHNVVAVCLPKNNYGTQSAAVVATHLIRSFPEVTLWIMVGVGGGIPDPDNDIRLGDIVVSCPKNGHPGIVEYDYDKLLQDRDSDKLGSLHPPPDALLKTINYNNSDPSMATDPLRSNLEYIKSRDPRYAHPNIEDRLYIPGYKHPPLEGCCTSCNGPSVPRPKRETTQPRVHYGLIASGNKLIRDANVRDSIGRKYNALCVEMEAAGIANEKSCLVIRGICDYADTHKNNSWQNYASGCAAVYAKVLLGKLRNFPHPSTNGLAALSLSESN